MGLGPRLVTAGIWKDIKLEFWNNAKIENVKIEQKNLSDKDAELAVHTSIITHKEGKYTISVNNTAEVVQLKRVRI